LRISICDSSTDLLYAVKSYDMVPPDLLPIRVELRIFIEIKNPSTLPDLNPQYLRPVASTLTTTPPRRLRLKCLSSFILQPLCPWENILRYLCEISSSHGGEYDVQSCLLGYTAV
jgi:hypothetical protein